MDRAELAFIPMAGAGHLAPMVELAKTLTTRDERVSVTVFIMQVPFESKLDSYTKTLLSNKPLQRVRFVHLTLDEPTSEHLRSKIGFFWLSELIQINKSRVKDFYSNEPTHSLSAIVVDMFCTGFADVAREFGVPDYVFFTSNACFLTLLLYLQSMQDHQNRDITELEGSDTELSIPGFVNPVPAKVLPPVVFDKEQGGAAVFVDVPRNLRKTKGILVNTFMGMESHAIQCLREDDTVPPIYAVGPVLNLIESESNNDQNDLARYKGIMTWLDSQPPASVVFLCFGSMGTFEPEQVVEIATALEQSGHRFLWSLRKLPPKDKNESPSEYENFNEVLPEGFMDRAKDVGKVIGWAPQIAVLSHPSVGGFVSHCGWNSTMESLWFGVPLATWPLYAEQQINAFEMVKEFGVAIEISLDYNTLNPVKLTSEEIEKGIKRLMDANESKEIRTKVNAIKEESQKALLDGGSSYAAIGGFIENVFNNASL